jgi:hypothetical protein
MFGLVCADWSQPLRLLQLLTNQHTPPPTALVVGKQHEESRDSGHSSCAGDDEERRSTDADSMPTDADEQRMNELRAKIIEEILNTERDYHRLIRKLVQVKLMVRTL